LATNLIRKVSVVFVSVFNHTARTWLPQAYTILDLQLIVWQMCAQLTWQEILLQVHYLSTRVFITLDIVALLNNSRPYVRKKACLVLFKVFLKFPGTDAKKYSLTSWRCASSLVSSSERKIRRSWSCSRFIGSQRHLWVGEKEPKELHLSCTNSVQIAHHLEQQLDVNQNYQTGKCSNSLIQPVEVCCPLANRKSAR
jgi:hypothetical protein